MPLRYAMARFFGNPVALRQRVPPGGRQNGDKLMNTRECQNRLLAKSKELRQCGCGGS